MRPRYLRCYLRRCLRRCLGCLARRVAGWRVVPPASPPRRGPSSFGLRLPGLGLAAIATIGLALAAHAPPALADGAFELGSTSFRNGGTVDPAQVFNDGDCKGGNRSPQLSWRNPPAGTRSFAVTIFDIDAPGPGWWHWAAAGIPATVAQLPENASASGFLKQAGAIEARNDFGTDGYGGPCPPVGKPHRYIVTVYALDTVDLRLAQGRPALMFDHEISTATLGYARMTVMYGR